MSQEVNQLSSPAQMTSAESVTVPIVPPLTSHNDESLRAEREDDNCKSGFLRLSPELRNRIYQDTIPTTTRISVVGRVDRKQISLLQVCRAIRNETVPIYYGNTTFTFDLRTRVNFQKATSWLDGLSSDAVASVRKIYVNSDPSCCCTATRKEEKTGRCQAWVDLDSTRWSFCGFEGCKICSLQERAKYVVLKIHARCVKQAVQKEDIAELFEVMRPIKAFDFSFEVAKDGVGKATFQDRPRYFGSQEAKAKPPIGREIKQPRTRRRIAGPRSSDVMPSSAERKTGELTAPPKTGHDSSQWMDPESEQDNVQLAPFDVFKHLDRKLRNALDDPTQDCVP